MVSFSAGIAVADLPEYQHWNGRFLLCHGFRHSTDFGPAVRPYSRDSIVDPGDPGYFALAGSGKTIHNFHLINLGFYRTSFLVAMA